MSSVCLPGFCDIQLSINHETYNASARPCMWWRGNVVGARKQTFSCSPRTRCAGEETGARILKRAAPVAQKEQFFSFFLEKLYILGK